MLKIYDSHSMQKKEFKPITEGKVGMYVCGVTVYDLCHFGHGRTFVAFDVIYRYLEFLGYEVKYVRNITDVDDKIIARAKANNETTDALVERMIAEMYQDFDALKIKRPKVEPKATENIQEMFDLIQKLLDNGTAYIAQNGDVMFEVSKFKDYGKLSKQKLEELKSGIRVSKKTETKSDLDFVLWKITNNEPSWQSPWGAGRPGWHIECSAMNHKELGVHFDIHGGGSDLLFPHHENELAQSACAYHTKMVNYWMHTGMLTIADEKMSKSLNNFFTIREILEKHNAEAVRYFFLTAHYRSLLNYSTNNLQNANQALTRLYTALKDCDLTAQATGENFRNDFINAMNDDFNTPQALAVLFDLAREINKQKTANQAQANGLAVMLKTLANCLGILEEKPENFLQAGISDTEIQEIENLIQKRKLAKQTKNWTEADAIRDQLTQMGIILEDKGESTSWRKI